MKLTERQKRFCDFFIETGNATEAARLAGYKGKNLNRLASENLSKLDIKNYIEQRNAELEEERIANIREVKIFWTAIMRDEAAEMKDRLKASEFLAKTNAAFKDKIEHGNCVGDHEEEQCVVELEKKLAEDPELQRLYMQLWKYENYAMEKG